MLPIRLMRVLFAGLMVAMLIAPVSVSRSGKLAPLPVGSGVIIPLGDCPNPSAGSCP